MATYFEPFTVEQAKNHTHKYINLFTPASSTRTGEQDQPAVPAAFCMPSVSNPSATSRRKSTVPCLHRTRKHGQLRGMWGSAEESHRSNPSLHQRSCNTAEHCQPPPRRASPPKATDRVGNEGRERAGLLRRNSADEQATPPHPPTTTEPGSPAFVRDLGLQARTTATGAARGGFAYP